jgi:GH15 family glucan-1,4-alpha-glucosidase
MANVPGTLLDDEVAHFLDSTRDVISRAAVRAPLGCGLLASPPDGKYPFADTRTLAIACVTFSELGDMATARAFCLYLLNLQEASGAWLARYDQYGKPLEGGQAEDATALAVWGLLSYIQASGDDAFAEQAREHVDEAARYTRARTLNPALNLVETTASLHGPGVSIGYDLWTNCAHAAAFALCHRVYGGERYRRLALLIRRSIGLLMASEGRFLRRLDPSGHPDPRPDVAQLAPYYFSLWAPTERMVMNSADIIERTLWNVESGGYCRFLPFSAAERTDLVGSSPCFSAWMAQYHYALANKDRAEAILRWLFDTARDGQLADILVSSAQVSRYVAERRDALAAGEAQAGQAAANAALGVDLEAVEAAAGERDTAPSGLPLVWAHLETLRALRKGGYVDRWELGPVPVTRRSSVD